MFFEMSLPRKYIPMTTTMKMTRNAATRDPIEPSETPIILATEADKYTEAYMPTKKAKNENNSETNPFIQPRQSAHTKMSTRIISR
jgi:hypothetical protein